MSNLIHRAPSVGSVVKKIMAIQPGLSAQQVIGIVRQSIYVQGGKGEFSAAEFVDEAKALELARQLAQQPNPTPKPIGSYNPPTSR